MKVRAFRDTCNTMFLWHRLLNLLLLQSSISTEQAHNGHYLGDEPKSSLRLLGPLILYD